MKAPTNAGLRRSSSSGRSSKLMAIGGVVSGQVVRVGARLPRLWWADGTTQMVPGQRLAAHHALRGVVPIHAARRGIMLRLDHKAEGSRAMARTYRVGIAGVTHGHVSAHLREWKEIDNVDLVAIADANKEERERYVTRYELGDVRQYGSIPELLEQEQLDVVPVCTETSN